MRVLAGFVCDVRAGAGKHIQHELEVLAAGVLQQHVAAGHGGRHRKGARLDAVRDDVDPAPCRARPPRQSCACLCLSCGVELAFPIFVGDDLA